MSRDVSQRPDLLVGRSGKSTNVHRSPLTFEFVADSWLDQGSFQGQATIQFRGTDSGELDLCMGGGGRRTTDLLRAIASRAVR